MVEAPTNLTNMFLTFMLICSVFNTFNIAVVASIECLARNEYQAGTECCPECPPGEHLVKDCTHGIITECSTCPDGTFQAGHTKEQQCSACTKCEAGLGLKVKKSCSSTSDAVCEVLDGFFCSDSNRGGCRAAQRHRLSCSPGHYIGQRGWCSIYCTDTLIIDKLLNKLTSAEPIKSCKGPSCFLPFNVLVSKLLHDHLQQSGNDTHKHLLNYNSVSLLLRC
uniref:TNFR-Cys domain-containing protein n=1 Tax=Gadus morhua TaxID=8049 RepID=A0A8C5CUU5_GADMO